MAGASDLLMIYVSMEFVGILSYVLAGLRRENPRSSEAALKYAIYGGAASGVMLFGLSLLYGIAGDTSIEILRGALVRQAALQPLALLALVMVLAGLAFKVAAVPFHQWCPDVYRPGGFTRHRREAGEIGLDARRASPRGRSIAETYVRTERTKRNAADRPISTVAAGGLRESSGPRRAHADHGVFSVGPKAAGFAVLIRFLYLLLGGLDAPVLTNGLMYLVGAVSIASMTYGNLAALNQTSVKRMLAYSSIAHAGYLLMGVATVPSSVPPGLTARKISFPRSHVPRSDGFPS